MRHDTPFFVGSPILYSKKAIESFFSDIDLKLREAAQPSRHFEYGEMELSIKLEFHPLQKFATKF